MVVESTKGNARLRQVGVERDRSPVLTNRALMWKAARLRPEKVAARGLELVRPTDDERNEISRIIMEELVRGVFKPEGVAYLQQVIARMQNAGCDAVILGCTELPLIMNDANSPLPTLDSTRLLARAAVRRAASQGNAGFQPA